MKNYLNQLDTDLRLTVTVNGVESNAQLQQSLMFNATDTVVVDNIEILPRYSYLAVDGKLTIDEPFYCWYHRVSGQGWLLKPQ